MPFGARKPYTELFEAVQHELVREAATGEEGKYKGFVNNAYLNDLPAVLPEGYIKKTGYIVTAADYTTGTVTVGTGTSNIIGSSTSWTSANSEGFYINVSGYNTRYRMTFDAGTSLTFQDSLTWTESSGTGLSYTLFKERYALPSDFNYMVRDNPEDPNVVFRYLNGVKIFLDPWTNEEFDRNFSSNIGSAHAYTTKWAVGSTYLYIQSNPDVSENIGFEYIPVLTGMRELTTGTATFTTGTALVLTSNASMTASLDTSRTMVIRNDADGTGSSSRWFQIASYANGSVATLSNAFSGTTGSGQSYTVSEISQWPARFDDVIMYKTAWLTDPDGNQAEKFLALYEDAINMEIVTESRRKRSYTFKSYPGQRN